MDHPELAKPSLPRLFLNTRSHPYTQFPPVSLELRHVSWRVISPTFSLSLLAATVLSFLMKQMYLSCPGVLTKSSAMLVSPFS